MDMINGAVFGFLAWFLVRFILSGFFIVNIIHSTAERAAAVEFGEAAAIRPKIVGEALRQISADPDVAATMFEILETQRILEANVPLEMIPAGGGILAEVLAAKRNLF